MVPPENTASDQSRALLTPKRLKMQRQKLLQDQSAARDLLSVHYSGLNSRQT
jgi:hypothetical protein